MHDQRAPKLEPNACSVHTTEHKTKNTKKDSLQVKNISHLYLRQIELPYQDGS